VGFLGVREPLVDESDPSWTIAPWGMYAENTDPNVTIRLRPGKVGLVEHAPRALSDPVELAERLARLHEGHIRNLNMWVEDLRRRLGAEAFIPWFDPDDGGIHASILWLAEAPGPRATAMRGGTGFVSCDNPDQTAENTLRTRVEAGVPRSVVVHWNAIPYYIGSERRIRSSRSSDFEVARPLLGELLALLPSLSCVILAGRAAQRAWHGLQAPKPCLQVIECPHASPLNLNTRPGARSQIVSAWRQAHRAARMEL
jgi:hypothetical protein